MKVVVQILPAQRMSCGPSEDITANTWGAACDVLLTETYNGMMRAPTAAIDFKVRYISYSAPKSDQNASFCSVTDEKVMCRAQARDLLLTAGAGLVTIIFE